MSQDRRWEIVVLVTGVVLAGGCSDPPDSGGAVDAAPDASLACTSSQPFVSEAPLIMSHEGQPFGPDGQLLVPTGLSADELTAYYDISTIQPSWRIHVATRPTRTDPFGDGVPLDGINSGLDSGAIESTDGLELYFEHLGTGTSHVTRAVRTDRQAPFAMPVERIVLDRSQDDLSLSTDGVELFFIHRPATFNQPELRRVTRNGSTFGPTEDVVQSHITGAQVHNPVISVDGLTLYYSRGSSFLRMWAVRRAARGQRFTSTPEMLTTTSSNEEPQWESPDGCRLYLVRNSSVIVLSREPS